MTRMINRIAVGICAAATWAALPSTLRADVLVLDSSVVGVKRGSQLKDDARLVIPAGKTVMIMRPSGETQEVSGPYDRIVGDLSRGETMGESFLRMKALLEQEAAGKSIGATRGITR